MKKLMLGLALLVGTAAQAHVASPVWTCKISAKVSGNERVELFLFRGETATAVGTATCVDAFGHHVTKSVALDLTSGSVGIAANGPLDSVVIRGVAAGLTTPDAMFGQYSLSGGVLFGFFDQRAGALGGFQAGHVGAGAKLELLIQNRNFVGFDIGLVSVALRPAAVRVKAKY